MCLKSLAYLPRSRKPDYIVTKTSELLGLSASMCAHLVCEEMVAIGSRESGCVVRAEYVFEILVFFANKPKKPNS
jgi:hypothetical protein